MKKSMKITKNGVLVETVGRNDIHNTFSPKHHKPYMRPGYKGKWNAQLNNNKILLFANAITATFGIIMYLGMDIRYDRLKADLGALQSEFDRNVALSEQSVLQYNNLLVEYASVSAKLEEKKLSSRALAHTKQQPIVAEKIKQVFGSEWVEATELYSRESSLNPLAINKNGGACGLVQFYPCSKLTTKCLLSDIDCQLVEGKKYIESRYGSAQAALNSNLQRGWY